MHDGDCERCDEGRYIMEEREVYTKEELKGSMRFERYKDAIEALLEEGKEYSVSEAEEIIEGFMKGEV